MLNRRRLMIAETLLEGGEAPEKYTWEGVLYHIQQGDYATVYAKGDLIPLTITDTATINMEIMAFDADELADGSGNYAHITFIGKEMWANIRINPALAGEAGNYTEGTGSIGGWEKCEIRSYLRNTIKPLLPAEVRNNIVSVKKYSYIYNPDGTANRDAETSDDVWIPSEREIYYGNNRETKGPYYNPATRIKTFLLRSRPWAYWFRSAHDTSKFRTMSETGYIGDRAALYADCVALGFCM